MAVFDDYALAVALQMLQVEEDLHGRSLGKLTNASDRSAAIHTFRTELNGAYLSMEDRRIAKSIGAALATDKAQLMMFQRMEEQEAADREFALRSYEEIERQEASDRALALRLDRELADDDNPQQAGPSHQARGQPRPQPQPQYGAHSCAQPSVVNPQTGYGHASSSSSYPFTAKSLQTLPRSVQQPASASAKAGGASSSRQTDCDICMEKCDSVDSKKVPCGHIYCEACFREHCAIALGDKSLIPVNCCKRDFPQDWIKKVLLPHQWEKYKRLLKDISQAHISRNLDPEYERTVARAGGKICPRCGAGVDLHWGCNHITCSCKHQFCFVCLAEWRNKKQTCKCELFSEEMKSRLQQAAQQPQQQAQQLRQQIIPQQQQQLAHAHLWERVAQGGECGQCGWFTPKFIFFCRGCGGLACLRCRKTAQ